LALRRVVILAPCRLPVSHILILGTFSLMVGGGGRSLTRLCRAAQLDPTLAVDVVQHECCRPGNPW
jgi:hypothetical protein